MIFRNHGGSNKGDTKVMVIIVLSKFQYHDDSGKGITHTGQEAPPIQHQRDE